MNTPDFPYPIDQIKGFLDPDEGQALFAAAEEYGATGPILEIGSYCGKSTSYLGLGCQKAGGVLYALDHHRGSEEHQLGEEYHDPDLYDAEEGRFDSLPAFRRTLARMKLEDTVIPLAADSALAARHWTTPLAMAFIDGGHSMDQALTDYRSWAVHVRPGGLLAIHDIFENPEDGGRPPYEIYQLALKSGLFEDFARIKTLGFLRKL